MTDTPEPKKRGRPPLGQKAMTPAQRKARQRSQPRKMENLTKEKFCQSILRDSIPFFVTSHIIEGTTWKPEYRAFWAALGIHSDKTRKQAEDWFFNESMAQNLRDKSQK